MSDYSACARHLSWYYHEPEMAQVFYYSDDLLEAELGLLVDALNKYSWLIYRGSDGEHPPCVQLEPSISEDASRFLACDKEFDAVIEDLPTRGTPITNTLFEEACSLAKKIRELRKHKRAGHFLRVDCGGGPITFGFVGTLTGEQFNAVADVMVDECHERRCIFDSISEYDCINNETLWLRCAHEVDGRDLYGSEVHRELWEIAESLVARFHPGDVSSQSVANQLPTFDGQRLLIGATEICKVSRKAGNQHLILSAFDEQGWSERIDDPLPGGADSQRLRETIRSLNERQNAIVFKADGSGKGVTWEMRGSSNSRALHTDHP